MYGWEYRNSPFPGYDLVAEDYWLEDWDWSLDAVYHKDGKFYTFSDGGCSCNGPYENADESDLVLAGSFQDALKGLSPDAIEQALAWERRNK